MIRLKHILEGIKRRWSRYKNSAD